MATEDTKSITESDGKKLWIFWVFGLGFFAGFLVSLVVADKLKSPVDSKQSVVEEQPQIAPPTAPAVPVVEEEPVRQPESHMNDGVQEVVMTKAMRDRLLTFDFMKILQDAEIKRYRFEGETRGVVLNKIRTGSIYEKIGFKDGDIIEQINGIALADIDRRRSEMTGKLPGADQIEFNVRRNDKIQKIRVKIADPGAN